MVKKEGKVSTVMDRQDIEWLDEAITGTARHGEGN